MQRKRGELVPIGEVFSDLGGPVKAIRDATPQARHHFTQADQVNQLVGASEADPDLGFVARLLVLCSLPENQTPDSLRAGIGQAATRLLRSATALRVTLPQRCGSRRWYGRKVPFRPEADCRFLGLLGVALVQLLRGI